VDAAPHVSVRRFADPRSLATMLRAVRVALSPVPTRSVTREKNLSHAFVCEHELHGTKKIRARGEKRLAGSRAHAMVRHRFTPPVAQPRRATRAMVLPVGAARAARRDLLRDSGTGGRR